MFRARKGNFCGRQDEGNKTEMIQACEKEGLDAPVMRCEKLAVVSLKRGRSRLKKHWKEVIRHHIVHLQLTRDMTLERKLWRSWIRVVD